MDKHYVGEHGTEFLLDAKSSISTATRLIIRVRKPSGTTVSWTAALKDTNKLKYIIKKNDFNEKGTYKFQAYIEMPGWVGRGETALLEIFDEFE